MIIPAAREDDLAVVEEQQGFDRVRTLRGSPGEG